MKNIEMDKLWMLSVVSGLHDIDQHGQDVSPFHLKSWTSLRYMSLLQCSFTFVTGQIANVCNFLSETRLLLIGNAHSWINSMIQIAYHLYEDCFLFILII